MATRSVVEPHLTPSVKPMVKVPSPTSKFGYHPFYSYTPMEYKPRTFGSWATTNSSALRAVSNRPNPIQGSPPLATDYYRKIANIRSLTHVDVTTDTHLLRGSTSIHSNRGLSLASIPYGSSYKNPGVSAPDWMVDQCVSKCIEDLHDLRANLLEDFGQAKQTVEMMGQIFYLIVDLYTAARKGNWSVLRKRLRKHGIVKSGANGWLMYYYGIRPLVSTLVALSESYAPKRKLKTVSKKVTDAVDPKEFILPVSSSVIATGKAEIGVKVGMTVAVDMTADMSMKTSLGINLDFQDAIVTAWALIPYSFVVDWILPVERFLRTRSWRSGLAYQSGYIDKRLTCLATYTHTNPMTGDNDRGLLPKAEVSALQLQRIAYNSFTPPSGLSLKLSLNPTQTLNAVALMLQRM